MHADDPDLRRLLDDAATEAIARERARRRWLRQQAEEEATFTGALLGLLEAGVTVTVDTDEGRRHQGRLLGLARDVLALRTAEGRTLWLRLDTVVAARAEQGMGAGPAADERRRVENRTLNEVLAGLAGERSTVQLRLRGTARPIDGQLRTVGSDVATVMEGDRRVPCYIRLSSVIEASLFDSG